MNLRCSWFGLFALLCLGAPAARAGVIINEIMFRPTGTPEPVTKEFIELYNPDAAAVDLSGAVFDKGIDFTFPSGVILPAGGYLVVVPNAAAFQATYPTVSAGIVHGPWTGTLSNSGQTIRLMNAGYTAELASLTYGSEGEWAQRVRTAADNGQQGWGWVAPAENTGKTLELRNPLVKPGEGQNWGASTPTGGTPGAVNSIAAADVAPFILGVKHSPAIPRATETVTVEADLVDMPASTITGTLYWRLSNSSPGAFNTTPMAKTGGATSTKYQAVLAAQPNLSIVEFYVSATDGTLTRTWPPPNNLGQTTNCLYQVDSETVTPGTAIYRVVMSVPENTQFSSMTTHTDAAMNCTFIGEDGSGPSVRYRSDIRYRGASSRDFSPAPNRINIPSDIPYNGSSKMNINSKYTWLQFIGMKLMNSAGVRSPDTKKVLLRRNGVNPISGTPNANYGYFAHLEPLGGEFIDNHFPDDSKGNLYKKVRPDNDWAYRSGSVSTYLSDGWLKESNTAANDWTQLDNFLRVMTQAQGSPTYLSQVQAVADLEQWLKWFAVETILANGETNASNGADDDYSLYFSGINQKAQFVPHDFDTILGQGDTIFTFDRTLFDMSENGDSLAPLIPLFGTTTGGGNAVFRAQYFTTLRQMCLTSFSQPRFDALIDNYLTGWVPAAKITELKTFMNNRRSYILGQCATALGTPTPAVPSATFASSLASSVKPLQLNEVMAKNDASLNVGGIYPDYVELHNTTAADISLEGMRLTNSPINLGGLEFPAATMIPAGGYLLVYGGAPISGELNLGFPLDADGGSLNLFDSVANGGALLDGIAFGPQLSDKTISRESDGSTWTLANPTPNAANGAAVALGDPNGVRFNEWLALPANRFSEDFLELYNPATLPVPIGGLHLTDDAINAPNALVFPELSYLPAQGFFVTHAKGNSASPENFSELPFSLSADQDWATLSGINGVVIDQINILCQVPDLSQGRTPDGALALQLFPLPTPGLPNATTAKIAADTTYANAVKLMNSIRVTELMYNPGNLATSQLEEFVEIRNISAQPVDLLGLRFTNGINFTFPTYTLAAGSYALVVADIAAFEAKYGTGFPIVGVSTKKLSNGGERVELQLPAPFDADVQAFTYKDSWYPDTDGGGHSLVVVNQAGALSAWDSKSGWASSPVVGGTPGTTGPPQITSALTASGTLGVSFSYQIAAANDPASFSASGLPDGLSVNTTTGLVSGVPTAGGVTNATITATNAAGSDNRTLVISIALPPAPIISSVLTATGYTTAPFSYTLTATNNPTTLTASGFPSWLTYNSTTNVLSGQPTALGTFNVILYAANIGGDTTKILVITISSDPLSAALDGTGLSYTRGGTTQWFVESATTHDGVDALQSGDINDSQETWVETTVTGPDRLSFWWKVDSESNYDYLNLNVNGTTVQSISGSVAWTQVSYDVPAGLQTIRWVYRKDGSVSTGADAGWLDEVNLASQSLTPIVISALSTVAYRGDAFSYQIVATREPTSYAATNLPSGLVINTTTGLISGITNVAVGTYTVGLIVNSATGVGTANLLIAVTTNDASIAAALDGEGIAYTRGGNNQWFSQTTTTHYGVDATRSGAIGPNQETWMEINVNGPDRLSFWWKVSSYQYGGYLSYMVDGDTYQTISNEVDWTRVVYDFPAGPHTFRWRYNKNSNTFTSGSDAGWVDQVALASQTTVPTILSGISATGKVGTPFSYQISATKNPTSFSASTLPGGLFVDTVTGLISGTPTTEFTGNITIGATGDTGTGTGSFFLNISSSDNAILNALDANYLTTNRSGSVLWRAQTTTTHDGVDAAEAPKLNADEVSILSATFTTTGPEKFSFWWKSNVTNGYLELYVDGSYVQYISGNTAWSRVFYDVGPGNHTVSWYYYKYSTASTATEAAWVDEFKLSSHDAMIMSSTTARAIVGQPFSFQILSSQNPTGFSATGLPAGFSVSPGGVITGVSAAMGSIPLTVNATTPVGTASDSLLITVIPSAADLAVGGDAQNLPWRHTDFTEGYWHTQYSVTHDGVDALQSGGIGHSQTSSFDVTVVGPGTFSYWWKVSSQSGSDILRLYLNGSTSASISGEQDWISGTLPITAGTHVLTFSYSKSSSTISGSDTAWVDQINFVPTNAVASPTADPDGDGMTNAQEDAAGTSPTDPNSVLRMIAARRNPNQSCHLEWDAVPGRSYAMDYSTNLQTWTTYPVRFQNLGTKVAADVMPLGGSVSAVNYIVANSAVKAIAPTTDMGTNWRGGNEAAFAAAGGDAGWLTGTQGVGYETNTSTSGNTPYTSYIGLNMQSTMYNLRSSAYIRIPFTVANAELVRTLTLNLRYEDGYAAYLNGVQVASDNTPSGLSYSSTASGQRADATAVVYRPYDLTSSIGLLKTGQNILAIHLLNDSNGSSDLLMQAVLSGTAYSAAATPPRIYWRVRTQ